MKVKKLKNKIIASVMAVMFSLLVVIIAPAKWVQKNRTTAPVRSINKGRGQPYSAMVSSYRDGSCSAFVQASDYRYGEVHSPHLSSYQGRQKYFFWNSKSKPKPSSATVSVNVTPRIGLVVRTNRPYLYTAQVGSYAYSRAFATKNADGEQKGKDKGEIRGRAKASARLYSGWSITVGQNTMGFTYNGSGRYNRRVDTVCVSLGGQLNFSETGPKITLQTNASAQAYQIHGDYAAANAGQDINAFGLTIDH